MKCTTRTISYGATQIDYELFIMNRKLLEIAVHPDKRVVVKAPVSSSIEAIENKLKKRARWIKRQRAYFNQFYPRTPEKRYLGGESHLYLGRKYRLKIQKAEYDSVLLKNGYFFINCVQKESCYVKDLLNAWYKQRATIYLSKVFDNSWEGFKKAGIEKPVLKLQKMEKRWGSLSPKGQLTLNLNLIQTSRECIEYVVIHEFCHLAYHNHSPEFYKLLDRIMPDWMKRKYKLEMSLV